MCNQLDSDFLEIAKADKIKAGSTLLMSMVSNGSFGIANLGDSTAHLLKQNGRIMKLTDDQTPNRSDEYDRIVRNNGFVTMKDGVARVDGSLAVSRAIGDIKYK